MEQRLDNFWKNKKILITGATGFVGSNLVKNFILKEAQVIAIDIDLNKDSLLRFEGLDSNCKLINLNIVDYEALNKLFISENIEYVFHLAAEVEVGRSQNLPFITFESNVKGTYNICEIVRNLHPQVKSTIIASSDKSYGHYPQEKMPYQEEYDLKPKYIYETSKAVADMIAQSYTNSFQNLPIVITRFCNIYGPGQLNPTAILPSLFHALICKENFVPRSDGQMIRDFIYIDDVVQLYEKLSYKLSTSNDINGNIFNFGSNSPIKVADLIETFCIHFQNEAMLTKAKKDMEKQKSFAEIDCQYMNYNKVEKLLGFVPTIELKEGLDLCFEWYSDFYKKKAK